MVVLLFVLSFLLYGLMELIPGDPVSVSLGTRATQELIEARREAWGLDKPFLARYWGWLVGVVTRGDFGKSFYLQEPVMGIIASKLPVTLQLASMGLLLAIIVGIPLGIVAAANKGRWIDRLAIILATIGVSVPGFWMGLNFIFVFAVVLGWLPSGGYVSPGEDFLQWLRSSIMPVLAIGLINAGAVARMMRSTLLEVLNEMYVTVARAKGVKERRVILKHGVRNAMLPVVTIVGLTFASLVGGTVVIETVFTIPGISRALLIAVNKRDNILLTGCILLVAAIFVIMNFLVDMCYAYLNPRIRYA
jgi:peptide/nickel transport system permease protein